MGKSKKKKNHTAPLWPGATPPPQRLFFSLECGSELFSQPLQRATTGLRSLGSTEGVAPGRRGAYVTQHAQEASRWEKKTHREMTERRKERGQGVCIWKVFSAPRQGPSLCGSDKERKSIAADAKREGAAKPAMSFITIGGWGNVFKAFRPTSKKPFYSQTKSTGRQPTARQGGWKQKFHCNSLFSQVLPLLFVCNLMRVHGNPVWKKIKTYIGLGTVREAAWETWSWFLLRRGSGFMTEEEPSVSLQTPPRMAHLKCSHFSSATTITEPQGKLKKQMEAMRGERRRGAGWERGRVLTTVNRNYFVKNNH